MLVKVLAHSNLAHRFYYNPKETEVLKQLSIRMANANFNYGFEYLGVTDKLVQVLSFFNK